MESNFEQGKVLFLKGLKALDINLEETQIVQFMEYYELMIKWNKVMNLTAITNIEDVVQKHFLDSLSIVKVFRPSHEKVLDMGTGAGFPGIPMKIAFPEIKVVLIDSLKKRINFLQEVIDNLKLKNISVIHGRAEDYGQDVKYREKFDICVSRAVAKLPTLSEYCLPYVKLGGFFISYKSGQIIEELRSTENAIRILGAELGQVHSFILPGTDIERSLVTIHKTKNTPMKYPRNAGKPANEPLL
ncbi:MAG TPA: 16S rRNA (guanine(527)-N(7))-methyltransferase RsmG [Mobilitalea sp.]|nr:16S rRNA (guanine(527)-N(7))-methyltransferase RsmG [Mobilitalea sp.]